MMKKLLRNHWVFLAGIWLTAPSVSLGQDSLIPPYNPTPRPSWNPPPAGFSPGSAAGSRAPGSRRNQPGGADPYGQYDDDSYFVPVDPPGGFDSFEDEDDRFGSDSKPASRSYGSSRSRGPRQVKDSFKMVEDIQAQEKCKYWSHMILEPTKFEDKYSCEMELDKKVSRSKNSISSFVDGVEIYKLRKRIERQLANRKEANKYNVSFDMLRNALSTASKGGCSCKNL